MITNTLTRRCDGKTLDLSDEMYTQLLSALMDDTEQLSELLADTSNRDWFTPMPDAERIETERYQLIRNLQQLR